MYEPKQHWTMLFFELSRLLSRSRCFLLSTLVIKSFIVLSWTIQQPNIKFLLRAVNLHTIYGHENVHCILRFYKRDLNDGLPDDFVKKDIIHSQCIWKNMSGCLSFETNEKSLILLNARANIIITAFQITFALKFA